MRTPRGRPPRRRYPPGRMRPRLRTNRARSIGERKRRWPAVLAILCGAIAIVLLWPAPEKPPAVAPSPPPAAARKAEAKLPEKAPRSVPRVATAAAPPRATTDASAVFRARRDLLLAAVRARAISLRPCVPGDGAELHVPVRLHVLRTGPVRAVDFPGEPPARELRDCVRRVATGWNFQDVALPADLELFATLALSPGA